MIKDPPIKQTVKDNNSVNQMANTPANVNLTKFVSQEKPETFKTPGTTGVVLQTAPVGASFKGSLMQYIKSNYKTDPRYMTLQSALMKPIPKNIKLGSNEELDYIRSLNPEYDKIITDPGYVAQAKLRGLDAAARRFEEGGKVEKKEKKLVPKNKKGNWIKKAVNPDHKGYCTPMTKSTCTPKRKAFALTMKKHHGFHKK